MEKYGLYHTIPYILQELYHTESLPTGGMDNRKGHNCKIMILRKLKNKDFDSMVGWTFL
jgi:hypothetical protein